MELQFVVTVFANARLELYKYAKVFVELNENWQLNVVFKLNTETEMVACVCVREREIVSVEKKTHKTTKMV